MTTTSSKGMTFGPVITTGSPLLSGEVGFTYATSLQGRQGFAPYSAAVVSGALPAGLTVGGQVISGTPTTAVAATFALQFTDSLGQTSLPVTYSLTVVPQLLITTLSTLPGALQGQAYLTQIVATGGAGGNVFLITNESGVNNWFIDPNTGFLTGTPNTPETDSITVSVTDALGYQAQQTFSVSVTANTTGLPTFSPVAGTYTTAQSVAISTTSSQASIFYTTDGTTPNATPSGTSQLYQTPVAVSATETLKAIAVGGTVLQQSVPAGLVRNTNWFIHGGTGLNNPPNGTFGLISEQTNPQQQVSGEFQTNTWDASALTGFAPVNRSTAQLSYAATGQLTNGQLATTTAQFEGNTIGVYLQSIDRPTDPATSKIMITPEIFYAGQQIYTGPSSVLYSSMLLQIPTASGDAYLNVNVRFSGPGGVFFTVNADIFHRGVASEAVTTKQDTKTPTYILNLPLGFAGSTTYMNTTSGAYTPNTWTGFQPFSWNVTFAQMQAALVFMQQTYGAAVFPSTDPTQYLLLNTHVNAEVTFTPVTADGTLGWSMQNWVTSLQTAPSAIASAPYTISAPVVTSTNAYTFNPGDYAISIHAGTSGTTSADWTSDIAALVSKPIPNQSFQAYGIGLPWGSKLEANTTTPKSNVNPVGSAAFQTQLRTDYPGFVLIESAFNALQTSIPGARMVVYFVGERYGVITQGSAVTTTNFDQSGFYLPHYINSCGGSLNVPNSYTTASVTNFPISAMYAGSSFFGLGLNNAQTAGTSYNSVTPMWWNAGVMQCYINMWQAFSLFKLNITAGPLSGQSLVPNACGLIECLGSQDEYSYNMGSNPPGFSFNAPPSTGGAASPSGMITQYKRMLTAVTGFFPNKEFLTNTTFGFNGTANDTGTTVASYVNAAFGAGAFSTITGVALSGADTFALDWIQGQATANSFKQGYAGIAVPATPTIPAVTNSLVNVMDYCAQVQPSDYASRQVSGGNNNATAVNALIAASNNTFIKSSRRLWSMGDGATFGNTAWTNYIQPTLVANATAVNFFPPSSIAPVPVVTSAVAASATSVTLGFTPLSSPNLNVQFLRNGSPVGTVAASTGTFTDTGLAAGTAYTYTLKLSASGTTGAAGPAFVWNNPVFSFANFTGGSSLIQTSWSAGINGAAINLTNGGAQHQAGCAYYKTQQNIQAFTEQFTFQIPAGGFDTATNSRTGLTLVIQNTNATTTPNGAFGLLASSDANLCGYGSYTSQSDGILGNSIGIKFDLSNGDANYSMLPGVGCNSTALLINGGPQGNLTAACDLNPFGVNLFSGHVMSVKVVYDGALLTMTIRDTTTNAQGRYVWPVNIPAIVGQVAAPTPNIAWVGFTGGTVPIVANKILSWTHAAGFNTRLATPTMSPVAGQYGSTQTVTLSGPAGASIYYTTNGLLPTSDLSKSTLYSGPITVSASTVLQAVAIQTGYTDSLVAQGNYQIATANLINYPTTLAAPTTLVLTGTAVVSGTTIKLTDTGTSETGSVWSALPVPVNTFTSKFAIQVTGGQPDGMTFCIQNQPPAADDTTGIVEVTGGPMAFSNSGGAMGYGFATGTLVGNQGGIRRSVAIKFVTSNNSTGVYVNGARPGTPQTTMTGISFSNGHVFNVTLGYTGTTLSFSIQDATTLATFATTFSIDVPTTVGASTAYVGFTASGGGAAGNQIVSNWTYSSP